MERFAFEIYLVQSCHTVVTEKRRALQRFWEDYFNSSDASVKFKMISVDAYEFLYKRPATAWGNRGQTTFSVLSEG